MAILAECPACHKKQSAKNKKCSCDENLDKAKKSKRVRYWINYRLPDGKQKSESLSRFNDLDPYLITDAQKAMAKRTVQVKERRIFDALAEMDITFNELTEWYLELKTVKKLKTLKRTKIIFNNFNAMFGDCLLSGINTIDLENYQEYRLEKGKAPATVDTEISIVKTMVKKAFNAGRFKIKDNEIKIDGDLMRAFDNVKSKLSKGSNARERIISIDEYIRLLELSAKHLRPMLIVAMNTGMRPGEISGLKWTYIDKDKKFIRIPAEMTKEGKKTGKDKLVPINHNVKAVLNSQVRVLHHDYIFTYGTNPLTGAKGVKKSFRSSCEKAGIVYGRYAESGLIFHDFRRTAKTYMAQAGVDKAFRDTILGHSLKGMDRHYIKPTEEMLKDTMEKYTDWLDKQVEMARKNIDQKGAVQRV